MWLNFDPISPKKPLNSICDLMINDWFLKCMTNHTELLMGSVQNTINKSLRKNLFVPICYPIQGPVR